MKNNLSLFSSYHTIYRLATTFTDLKSFALGIARIYKNSFASDKATIILKNTGSRKYIKISLKNNTKLIKQGGLSILTRIEKDILKQENELILDKRLIYPFTFINTLGGIYIKRGRRLKKFTPGEKKWFYSLCEEVSLALKVFSLYKEQQKIILNYIKSISNFLSQYVPTSRLHTKYIFPILKAIEKEMNLSQAEIKSLEFAALLHDVGKMNLPAKLLQKQKPLTVEEFKMITKHPRKGTELIKNLESLKPVMPIILYHHERYDGKGYPSGIKKNQIPIGARILSVIDSFDAMYFGRPYRKGCSLATVKKELEKQKGKQFDPKIIDILLKVLKRKKIKRFLASFRRGKK